MRLYIACLYTVLFSTQLFAVLVGVNAAFFIAKWSRGKRDVWDWIAILGGLAFAVIFGFAAVDTFKFILSFN